VVTGVAREEAEAWAVVATDSVSADADYDNGTSSMVPGHAPPRRVDKLLLGSLGHDPSGIRRR
jgi:hypothetical protein